MALPNTTAVPTMLPQPRITTAPSIRSHSHPPVPGGGSSSSRLPFSVELGLGIGVLLLLLLLTASFVSLKQHCFNRRLRRRRMQLLNNGVGRRRRRRHRRLNDPVVNDEFEYDEEEFCENFSMMENAAATTAGVTDEDAGDGVAVLGNSGLR
ncbi:hypothetical protein BOX15_Mlig032921g2 [Macrostomum lignano]|uniref:Uncharacterized protein n=1 Tax=Macrostomum lignano TaxID=282301 RepID=A0A267GKX6_9PLAT|nr:hypothetical protein BOX15_Mlig032921g2 [Macrostomum lignano]